eukprot:403338149
MVSVIQRQQANVVNSNYKRNLSFDNTALNLTKKNFDMAAYVSYVGSDPKVQDDIDTYFTMRMFQAYLQDNPDTWGSYLDWRLNDTRIEKCTEGRFVNLNESTKVINITGNFWCPRQNFSLKLTGSSSSEISNMIYITVDYCSQTQLERLFPGQNKKCKTIDESNQILAFTSVYFAILTQYFDGNQFEKAPIVDNIQTFYYPLNEMISYNQVFKYSLNYAITQDSWLANAYDNKNLTYHTIRSDYLQIGTRNLGSEWMLFTIEIDLDQDYMVTQRTVMTILDAFSNVGGLMGIMIPLISLLISGIQHQLFMQSIIKRVFLFKPKTKSKNKLPENNTSQENSRDNTYRGSERKSTFKIGPTYSGGDFQFGSRFTPQTSLTHINENLEVQSIQNDQQFD